MHCVLTIVSCVDSAIRNYNDNYDGIFLDHDLGGLQMVNSDDLNTGYAFCDWLIKNTKSSMNTPIVIHSVNPVGAKNMLNILSDGKFSEVFILPYPTLQNFWFSNKIRVGGKEFKDIF